MGPEPGPAARQALLAIRQLQAKLDSLNEPVAIIGMGCRYPGAENVEAFWRLLAGGVDAVTEVPPERWAVEALYNADASVPGKMASRWGGFLRGLDEFDPEFFGITPREAPHVDPRQRLIMESAWEALEAAGIPPDSLAGCCAGVFIATLTNDYDHLLFQDLIRAEAFSGSGTANSIVANRLSYFLDLKGPSLALDTACSGSLIAIHLACESLRKGESTLALAGGVNLNLMPKSSVFFSKAGALSPTGRCKTFDAAADGIVRSDGAGVLVLKLLSQAQKDRDPIVAVIRGSAVNHDGRSNGIMAPNGEAQVEVLREAYRRAGVAPAVVQYVETHGTGTKLGDPIEVRALGDALSAGRAGKRCSIGSVKTNIGHTEAAAGAAGVIKAALAISRRMIPPSLHFREPNPLIPFAELPFDVQTELGPWPDGSAPLIAGVSAFGFGGANAHVVLGEPPELAPGVAPEPPFILPISARSPGALAKLAASYDELLDRGAAVGDVCYTASARRAHHPYRIAVTGGSAAELSRRLKDRAAPESPARRPVTAFVFSGQGSHWRGMGDQLYRREPVFRAAIDECADLFRRLAGWDLRDEIRGPHLNDTAIAQPAIFAIQAALAALWQAWGITPDFIVGHSLGEAAAAYAAGALSLEEASAVVFHRSRLMKSVEGKGRTAVVGMPPERAAQLIAGQEDKLAVAGSNSPSASVISGETAAVERLIGVLTAQNVFCRLVQGVEIAFHSPHMDALMPELERELRSIAPRPARVLFSTVTGERIAGEALTAGYWARNLRSPFLFAQATQRLIEAGCRAFVEVSPHAVLASSIAQTVRQAGGQASVVSSLRRDGDEAEAVLSNLAVLYEAGHSVAWSGVYPEGCCVPLPHYPWQRQRYWFDQLGGGGNAPSEAPGVHPLLGESCEPAAAAERTRIWERAFDLRRMPYFADHKLWGDVILPGAAMLEMATAAARELWPGEPVSVRSIAFEAPIRLDAEDPVRVQFAAIIRGGEADFSVFSRHDSARWTRHATGRIGPEADTPAQPGIVKPWPDEAEFPLDQYYEAMEGQGLQFGPAFRGIDRLWRGEHEALGLVRLPAAFRDERYRMHPAALDAAIRITAAAIPSDGGGYLPAGAGRWRTLRHADVFWCKASVRHSGETGLEADLDFTDDDGRLVAKLEGLALARIGRSSLLAHALIEEHWEERPLASSTARAQARWALLGAGEAFCDALKERGHAVSGALDSSVTDVVCRGDVEYALKSVQAVLRDAPQARVWLTTDGSLDSAPVEGFALSLALEHPELRPTLVRLEAGADVQQLLDELLRGGDEPRVAWRAGSRYVARLRRARPPRSEEASLRQDATYLITGGLGALGSACARLLARLGARHLVLVGRSARTPLEIPGSEVRVVAADLADRAEADRLFASLASMPPLRGVIHAAGVLDDGLVQQQSAERFRKVLAPKIRGAWNLHERTVAMQIDFFVLFSSAASLLGSAGQSNYAAANTYLDALALYRRGLGLPALSINWGAWESGGMAADSVRQRMASRGVGAIEPEQGLSLLAQLIAKTEDGSAAQIGVVPVDWPVFLSQTPPALLSRVESFAPAQARTRGTFRKSLDNAPPSERPARLRQFLHDALAGVLGFRSEARIAPQQRFFELGMDSLMSLEFRNRLESELGVKFPSTLAFDYPSLESLGNYVEELLVGKSAAGPGETQLDALTEEQLADLLAAELSGDAHAG